MKLHNQLLNTPIDSVDFAVVDTETTGMNSKYCRVMDIGIVKVKNGQITETWEALIDPKQKISYWITHYTNLANKDVDGKPLFSHYAPKINNLLTGSVFVAHNVGFDFSFMKEEFKRCDVSFEPPRICTVMLGRKLVHDLDHANLDVLSKHFGITISARHRALPDALATAELLIKFIDIAKNDHGISTFYDLERLQWIKAGKSKGTRISKNTISNKDDSLGLF